MSNKAFFLDRDGTIIKDKGYLDSIDEIEIIEGVPEVLRRIKEKGYLIIVISNQSGVARGYFDENKVQQINNALRNRLLKEYDVLIDKFYYCPHHPDYGSKTYRKNCACRKPKPGMVLQAVQDFDIDISKSVVIGDKDSDRIETDGLAFIKIKKDENWKKNDELNIFLK